MKYWLILVVTVLLLPICASAQWVPGGPYGGNLRGLYVSDSTLFTLISERGYYVSRNMGLTWDSCFQTTNEKFFRTKKTIFSYDLGLSRSTDDGKSWSAFYLPAITSMSGYLDTIYSFGEYKAFRSTDEGATWDTLPPFTSSENTYIRFGVASKWGAFIVTDTSIYQLDFDANSWVRRYHSAQTIFSIDLVADTIYLSSNNMCSVDGGLHWEPCNPYHVVSIQKLSSGALLVQYAINYETYLLISTDGITWEQIPQPTLRGGVIVEDSTIYIVADSIYISKTQGKQWKTLPLPFIGYQKSGYSLVKNGNIIIGNSNEGFYLLPKGDSIWHTATTGLQSLNMIAIANPYYNDIIFTKAELHNAGFRSEDGGKTWTYNEYLTQFMDLGCKFYHYDSILLAQPFGRVFYSPDSGKQWSQYTTTKGNPGAISIISDTIFISVGNSNYRSIDRGITWDSVRGYKKQIGTIFRRGTILYSYGNCFNKSTDGGLTWDSVSAPSESINSFLLAEDSLFICCNGDQVLLSSDLGVTWTSFKKPSSPTIYSINQLLYYKNHLFGCSGDIDNRGSVFYSTDFGETWHFFSDSRSDSWLEEAGVRAIAIVNNELWAGLENIDFPFFRTGIWRFPLTILGIEDDRSMPNLQARQNEILHIYPNPAKEKATISFHTWQPSKVSVVISDLLGNKKLLQSSSTISTGEHRLDWNTNNISNGSYIVQLVIDGTVYEQKIVVLH